MRSRTQFAALPAAAQSPAGSNAWAGRALELLVHNKVSRNQERTGARIMRREDCDER
jgi:hypothetical protein